MKEFKIGKTIVTEEQIKEAVTKSRITSEIVDSLGLNHQLTSHVRGVKAAIEECEIDVSNIRYYRGIKQTEKFERYQEAKIKQFNLIDINQKYYDAFKAATTQSSFTNYKTIIGNFMEENPEDFVTVDFRKIEEYAASKPSENTQKNALAYSRSFMIFIVSNNIEGAVNRVSKETLIWLITSTAKK